MTRLVGTNLSGCKLHTRHLVLCSLKIYLFVNRYVLDAKPLGPNVRCKTDTTPNRTPSPCYTKNLTSYNKESNHSLVAACLKGFANKECSVSARRLTRPVGTNLVGSKRCTRHLVEIYLFVSSHGQLKPSGTDKLCQQPGVGMRDYQAITRDSNWTPSIATHALVSRLAASVLLKR